MSETGHQGQPEDKQAMALNQHREATRTQGVLSVEVETRRYWISSLALHLVVAAALLFSWSFVDQHEDLPLPEHIQARVATEAEMQYLEERKETRQRQVENDKKAEQQREQENKRKAEQAEQQKRDAEAKKKALIQKKKDEERKEKEKKEKEKKDKAKELERQKQESDKLEKQKKEQLEKEEQNKKEQERLRQEREANLKKKLAQAESDEKARQDALAERSRASRAASEREVGEVERFKSLIKARIEGGWRKPPESRGLMVLLEIRLFPNGEVAGVQIVESSGVDVFDRSAMNEVKRHYKFPVPEDIKIFEKHFRKFNMVFRGLD